MTKTIKVPGLILIAVLVWRLFFSSSLTSTQTNSAGETAVRLKVNCPTTFQAGFSRLKKGNLVLSVWYPTFAPETAYHYGSSLNPSTIGSVAVGVPAATCGPYPLVVFSHGYGGCAIQTLYFTEELARRGYIVAAPDHHDALCGPTPEGDLAGFDLNQFLGGKVWQEKDYYNRRDDLRGTIDWLLQDNREPSSRFYQLINPQAIGLAGHSLGGYSVLGLAGAWPTWEDKRVGAVVAFSPFVSPYLPNQSFKNIKVPVMYQAGTLDRNRQPLPAVFEASHSPKVSLMLKLASHLAWSNFICRLTPARQCLEDNERVKIIDRYAISFFDRYLKGQKSAEKVFTAPSPFLDSLQYKL